MDEEISEMIWFERLVLSYLLITDVSQLQMFRINIYFLSLFLLYHPISFYPVLEGKANRQRKIYLDRYNAIFQAKDTNMFGHRDLCCLSGRHFSADKFPLVSAGSAEISRTMFSRNSNLSHLSLYDYAIIDILSFLSSN